MGPVRLGEVHAGLQALGAERLDRLAEHVAAQRAVLRGRFQVRVRGVVHREPVVVLGGEHQVAHPRVGAGAGPLGRVVLGAAEGAPLVVVPVVVLGVRAGEVLGRVRELPQALAVQGPRAPLPDRGVEAPVDDHPHLEVLPVLECGLRARILRADVPRIRGSSQSPCRLEIVCGEIVCSHQNFSPPSSMPRKK